VHMRVQERERERAINMFVAHTWSTKLKVYGTTYERCNNDACWDGQVSWNLSTEICENHIKPLPPPPFSYFC
jgi:hypothetical protein